MTMETRSSIPASTPMAPALRPIIALPLIVLAVAAGLALVWYSAPSLLLLFAGILFASLLDACTRGLGHIVPMARPWRYGLVVVVFAACATLGLVWGIARLRPGACLGAGHGRAARRAGTRVGGLRHRFVRSDRAAGPVAISLRSGPPVRPCPVRRHGRLCRDHEYDRRGLPRPVLCRSSHRLPRGRLDPGASSARPRMRGQ